MTFQTVALTENGNYLVDGSMTVPNSPGNRHYQEVQEWIAAGNTPEPYVEPPVESKTQFTSLEFLDRFTEEEQVVIVAATANDVYVKLFYDRLLAATYVDLIDPRTEMGIDLLISKGLLNSSRKVELLEPEEITQ